MSSEWRSGRLGDFIELKRGYDLPQGKRRSGAVPLVSSSGVTDSHDQAMASGPGVVTGRYGTIGQVFFVEQDFWPLNTTLYVRDFKGNDPKFISYFLRTLDFSAYSDKAAVPGLNRNHLHEASVALPELNVQKTIAACLGSLDDRIALLRETNSTLEAIAQALFKSWFVDFDPVRAKSRGLAPAGMDEATAALFPDAFEESALGTVPRGWRILRVEDLAERIGMGPFGSNIKVETFVESGIPVLNGANVQCALLEDLNFRFVTEEHATRLRNSCVHAGDIVLTHRGTLGQVSLVPDDSKYPEYVLSQSQFFLRCAPSVMEPEWMLYFLRSPMGQHLLLANASQVGVPSIARPSSYLRSMRLVVPPIGIVSRFAEVARSMHRVVVSNRERGHTLSNLRDALLPRLISGQLRLPDAVEVDAALA